MAAKISVLGFISALVHSHIYWMYSIIYITYHKISPPNKPSSKEDMPTRRKLVHAKPASLIVPKEQLPAPVIRRRKLHRHSSTGELFKRRLSTLMEVDPRSLIKVDILSLTDSNKSVDTQEHIVGKRDRGFGLFRSKFQKSYSTNDIHSLTQPRRRKRDAILVIFSGRSSPKEETIKKRTKLFRSLPSWKKA